MNDWGDGICTVHIGEVRAVLAALPAESVHCVVTSPPYWGLRDYGTAAWLGGDPACDHKGRNVSHRDGVGAGPEHGAFGDTRGLAPAKQRHAIYRTVCGRCGAERVDAQLGLERTPEEYVAAMVAVFAEVRRVLRKDGTVWLNMGDCYTAGVNGQKVADKGNHLNGHPRKGLRPEGVDDDRAFRDKPFSTAVGGLKPKDLVGMPWMLAFALRADGWYLRCDVVWSKPNPMPESVTDRPTKAHEYVFLLTKSERYFYDADAIREPSVGTTAGEVDGGPQRGLDGQPVNGGRNYRQPNGAVSSPFGQGFTRRSVATDKQAESGALIMLTLRGTDTKTGFNARYFSGPPPLTRNKRSVWTIATQPYSDAHFATFPEALVEPCVLAGTSERGCCPECGAPWRRLVDVEYDPKGRTTNGPRGMANRDIPLGSAGYRVRLEKGTTTTGWQPTCAHGVEPVPCTVLDPFVGSGTTLAVARRLNRNAVGIDLDVRNLRMIRDRCAAAGAQTTLLLG